jgi:hypothetical protein
MSAAGALGYALQLSNGNYSHEALLIIASIIALGLLVLLLASSWTISRERYEHGPAITLGVAALVVSFAVNLANQPTISSSSLYDAAVDYTPYQFGMVFGSMLVWLVVLEPPLLRRLQVPAMLCSFFVLGLWMLRVSPAPGIDVWVWHQEAYRALGLGQSPWAISIPNIYTHTLFYGAGLADANRVYVGYPYPPVTFLYGGLGQLFAGDYRYANLVALTLTGGFIAYARPGRLARIAAALFLFTPRSLFVLDMGWTEPVSVCALAGTLFCACRFPRALPYAFGLMIGAKQYFVFALLLLPLLLSTFDVRLLGRFVLKAALVPSLLTLPFLLWAPWPFVESVVVFQAKQPFRPDALSLLAHTAKSGVNTWPLNVCFIAVLLPLGLGLLRAARTPAGFALVFSLSMLVFFFFAKQAFCNYYFLVLGGFCCAAGMGSGAKCVNT